MKKIILLFTIIIITSCSSFKKKHPRIDEFVVNFSAANQRLVGWLSIKKINLSTLTLESYKKYLKKTARGTARLVVQKLSKNKDVVFQSNAKTFVVCVRSITRIYMLCDEARNTGIEEKNRNNLQEFKKFYKSAFKKYL